MRTLWQFVTAYVKSMRLYYAFITGITGWVGVSFREFCGLDAPATGRKTLILTVLFLSWGVNQIVNDFLGLAEDRINAPNRPMVTGALAPVPAMIVSSVIMTAVAVASWFLNPWAIAPVLAGVLLNVLYEYAKDWSLAGNLVFGVSIAMCAVYGFVALGPLPEPLFTSNRLCGFALLVLLNGLMTYYTYFKDYTGDLQAGKRTFIVRHGIDVARYAGGVGALLPAALFGLFHLLDWLPMRDILYPRDLVFCGAVTLFLQLWAAWLFFRYPRGEQTYFALAVNIRACVAGQVTIIAIFNGTLALYLLPISYVLIGFLFHLYPDPKS